MADETKPNNVAPARDAVPGHERPAKARKQGDGAGSPAASTGAVVSEAGGGSPAAPAPAAAPTAAELLGDDSKSQKIIRAKGAKNISVGVANILATFNNTQVTITDMQGNTIGWSTSGRVGFKGSRKSTAYAAQQAAQDAARQAMSHGMREVEVRVCGPG